MEALPLPKMTKDHKVFVAGHRGLVGSAICLNLQDRGYQNIIVKKRNELNLLDAQKVDIFFEIEKMRKSF